MDEFISLLSRSLPQSFDFYHLGNVEAQSCIVLKPIKENVRISDDLSLLGYNLTTLNESMSAVLVLIFDRSLNESMYSELGNILVSRIINKLDNIEEPLEAVVSPPFKLKNATFERILATCKISFDHYYIHHINDTPITVRMMIVPKLDSEELGNA